MPPFYAHFTISDVPIKQTMVNGRWNFAERDKKGKTKRVQEKKKEKETQEKKSDVRRVQEQCFQLFWFGWLKVQRLS